VSAQGIGRGLMAAASPGTPAHCCSNRQGSGVHRRGTVRWRAARGGADRARRVLAGADRRHRRRHGRSRHRRRPSRWPGWPSRKPATATWPTRSEEPLRLAAGVRLHPADEDRRRGRAHEDKKSSRSPSPSASSRQSCRPPTRRPRPSYKILICHQGPVRDGHQPASVRGALHHAHRRNHERRRPHGGSAGRRDRLDDER
jgi:hypothetical protein